MSINSIKNRLKETSKKDNTWFENAKFRRDNKDWLDISFAIAVRIMAVLSRNKELKKFPKNQKELAFALECTPQYVSKLLKGSEKMNIETISKIQKTLNISIIDSGVKRSGIKIVAQQEEKFSRSRLAKVGVNYKKNDDVIQFNFRSSRSQSQPNDFRTVCNG